jgi:hypothetical protein
MNDFAGFPPPTKNFFSLPNEIINIIADITNISELKVILYVIRHTWGYQEFGISKLITNDEFMHGRRHVDGTRMDKGTGLSEQAVRDGTGKAIKDGYLICDIDDSDRGRIKKSYRLKMLEVKSLDPQTLDLSQSRGLDAVPPTSKTLTSGPGTLDPRTRKRRPRTEKETLEKHLGETPEERKNDDPPTSSPSGASSFSDSNSQDVRVEIRESLSLGGEQYPPTVSISDKPHENAQTSYILLGAEHALALLQQLEQQRTSLVEAAQGGVTVPPPSVKGGSLSTTTGGDAQPFSPDLGTKGCASEAPHNVAASPIATQPGINSSETGTQGDGNTPSISKGYMKDDDHSGVNHNGDVPSGSEHPDNVALVETSQQSASTDETPPEMQPCVITQELLIDWLEKAGACPGLPASQKRAIEFLRPQVAGPEDVEAWYKIAREHHEAQGRTGPVYFANVAKPWIIEAARLRSQQAASQPIDRDEPMTEIQADQFAKWLMSRGFAHEVVAIDKDKYAGQWYTCLEHEPGRWIYLEGPKHFNARMVGDPSDWERARILQARARGNCAVKPREVVAV